MSKIIQSIRFEKKYWNVAQSKEWVRRHNYKIIPFGPQNRQYKNYIAMRQIQPQLMKNMTTIKIPSKRMLLIVGYMK